MMQIIDRYRNVEYSYYLLNCGAHEYIDYLWNEQIDYTIMTDTILNDGEEKTPEVVAAPAVEATPAAK